jgi:hypothetical protein
VAKASFTFNIHITNAQTGAVLKSVVYNDPTTGIELVEADSATTPGFTDVYSLSGVRVKSHVATSDAVEGLTPGIYVIGNKKVIIR